MGFGVTPQVPRVAHRPPPSLHSDSLCPLFYWGRKTQNTCLCTVSIEDLPWHLHWEQRACFHFYAIPFSTPSDYMNIQSKNFSSNFLTRGIVRVKRRPENYMEAFSNPANKGSYRRAHGMDSFDPHSTDKETWRGKIICIRIFSTVCLSTSCNVPIPDSLCSVSNEELTPLGDFMSSVTHEKITS